MWGSESFGYIEAGLPEHYHNRGNMEITGWAELGYDLWWQNGGGAFSFSNYGNADTANNVKRKANHNLDFHASRTWSGLTSSPKNKDNKEIEIYGNSDTVQPPAVGLKVKTRFK